MKLLHSTPQYWTFDSHPREAVQGCPFLSTSTTAQSEGKIELKSSLQDDEHRVKIVPSGQLQRCEVHDGSVSECLIMFFDDLAHPLRYPRQDEGF